MARAKSKTIVDGLVGKYEELIRKASSAKSEEERKKYLDEAEKIDNLLNALGLGRMAKVAKSSLEKQGLIRLGAKGEVKEVVPESYVRGESYRRELRRELTEVKRLIDEALQILFSEAPQFIHANREWVERLRIAYKKLGRVIGERAVTDPKVEKLVKILRGGMRRA